MEICHPSDITSILKLVTTALQKGKPKTYQN